MEEIDFQPRLSRNVGNRAMAHLETIFQSIRDQKEVAADLTSERVVERITDELPGVSASMINDIIRNYNAVDELVRGKNDLDIRSLEMSAHEEAVAMAKDSSSRNTANLVARLRETAADVERMEIALKSVVSNLLRSLDANCELAEMLVGIITSMENAEKEDDDDF